MRQIALDTETTGLSHKNGHRIIEVACVEIIDRRITGKNLQFYINPERNIDAGAVAVHGLTKKFLANKPKFKEISKILIDFISGSNLIIHNATFDLGFLDAEFLLLNENTFTSQVGSVIDTLVDARKLYPGKRNSLDALCERLGVSNADRALHGALLDSKLLAKVYLAMTRGQESLIDSMDQASNAPQVALDFSQLSLPIILANAEELAAHEEMI